MSSLYKSSGYNLDRIELIWMWLESQAERINDEKQKADENKDK